MSRISDFGEGQLQRRTSGQARMANKNALRQAARHAATFFSSESVGPFKFFFVFFLFFCFFFFVFVFVFLFFFCFLFLFVWLLFVCENPGHAASYSMAMRRAWAEAAAAAVVTCLSVLLGSSIGRAWLAACLHVPSLPAGVAAALSSLASLSLALLAVCPWPSRSARARALAWLAIDADVHGVPPEQGVVGLVNLGNSCYQNATIQALAAEPGLAAYFLSGEYEVHRAWQQQRMQRDSSSGRSSSSSSEGCVGAGPPLPRRADYNAMLASMLSVYR